jgi:predicted O-linked N-acetylglucosamine transferase (SPINDLY family)
MDYFISADHYELPDSEAHYSEKLFRMKDVASCAYYYKPVVPEPLKPRSHFGLDDDEHLYICPQVLFKFHPDFDEILGQILRADPKGRLILIEGRHPHWKELLQERFQRNIPDVTGRIQFLPAQNNQDFVNLIAVSDVMLDTIHFCGQNTTHEAMAVGTPVVTWPGAFHRARHTLGFYQRMGVMDCVARSGEEYARIAVRLGTDPGFREQVRQRIIAGRDIIWEERGVIEEYERFFIMAVDASRNNNSH